MSIAVVALVLAFSGIVQTHNGFGFALMAIESCLFVGIVFGPTPFRVFAVGFLSGSAAELAVGQSLSFSWMFIELFVNQDQAIPEGVMWLAIGSGLFLAGVLGSCLSMFLWYKLGLNRLVISIALQIQRHFYANR